MLDQISTKNIIRIADWKNGKCGYIFDCYQNGELRFIEHTYDEATKTTTSLIPLEYEHCARVIAGGFVGFFISRYASGQRDIMNIFETYTKRAEEAYIHNHREDIDCWKRDLVSEFYSEIGLNEETMRKIDAMEIFDYLCDEDAEFVNEAYNNYMGYLSKLCGNKENPVSIKDCFYDTACAEIYIRRLHDKIDPIIKSKCHGHKKMAMLYINAAQKSRIMLQNCKAEPIIKEFNIDKTSFLDYKYKGKKEDYIEEELLKAEHYIKTGEEK